MSLAQPTLEDVWMLFRETDRRFQETERLMKEASQETDRRFQETERLMKEASQETDRRFQETERLMKEASQETDRRFQEADRRFQEIERIIKENHLETERILKEKSLETDLKFQETDRKFQETEKLFRQQLAEIKRLENLFESQWGRLMESLVEGDLVNILKQRGITVQDTSTRLKGSNPPGDNYEFDIVAHNGEEVVVVEVKTTLKPKAVKEFIRKLEKIKTWLPRYAQNRIYGAVAYLTAAAGAESMAEKLGLFVIRATGDSASIINAESFRPRDW